MSLRLRRSVWLPLLLGGLLLVAPCRVGLAQEVDMAGVQIWNTEHWGTTNLGDYYGPNYNVLKLKPMLLAGCRNGVFSSHVVVTWTQGAIEGLKATVTDLKTESGSVIAASNIQVRFAHRANSQTGRVPDHRFDPLLKDPPETIEVVQVERSGNWKPKNPFPVSMIPVWVTIRVPKDAAPGEYEGQLKVVTERNKLPAITVKLQVADWTMPDPKDFEVQTVALQSQESVAKHYGAKMWSDEHLRLMGESLNLLAQLNSRQLAMNLTIDYYGGGGNDETMVRWIKQPDGTYKHDFTPFDKYLELAARTIGKPNMLRLNCWGEWTKGHGENVKEKASWAGPSKVSLLDPETGELTPLDQPDADTPEFLAFWKPVLTEALARIEKRGWLDVTALGANSYCWGVSPELVDAAYEIWPAGAWAYTAHNGSPGMQVAGTKEGVRMPVRYPEHIWAPGPGARMGGRGYKLLLDPEKKCIFHTMRNQFWDYDPLRTVKAVTERCISSGHDGVSDFGGDFFPVPHPRRRGRYYFLGNGRGTGGPSCSTISLLAPGPKEPVATERFEAYREGMQVCEAMLYVQKGIDSGKLPAALAAEADKVLQERAEHLEKSYVAVEKSENKRFDPDIYGENSVERENNLFAVAAKIAAALK